ncbi:MAG: hypothetical protein Fur0025_39880 [Oscillatoriaceae cyanobacterium]
MMENPWRATATAGAMNVLIRSLQQAWSERYDFFTGGNMFVYYSSEQVMNKEFRGPDFFAVLDV